MPVSETPRTATSHTEAEIRLVVKTLRSYGPLHERTLCRLVHDERWREGSLSLALRGAVERGLVRPLGIGFYEAR